MSGRGMPMGLNPRGPPQPNRMGAPIRPRMSASGRGMGAPGMRMRPGPMPRGLPPGISPYGPPRRGHPQGPPIRGPPGQWAPPGSFPGHPRFGPGSSRGPPPFYARGPPPPRGPPPFQAPQNVSYPVNDPLPGPSDRSLDESPATEAYTQESYDSYPVSYQDSFDSVSLNEGQPADVRADYGNKDWDDRSTYSNTEQESYSGYDNSDAYSMHTSADTSHGNTDRIKDDWPTDRRDQSSDWDQRESSWSKDGRGRDVERDCSRMDRYDRPSDRGGREKAADWPSENVRDSRSRGPGYSRDDSRSRDRHDEYRSQSRGSREGSSRDLTSDRRDTTNSPSRRFPSSRYRDNSEPDRKGRTGERENSWISGRAEGTRDTYTSNKSYYGNEQSRSRKRPRSRSPASVARDRPRDSSRSREGSSDTSRYSSRRSEDHRRGRSTYRDSPGDRNRSESRTSRDSGLGSTRDHSASREPEFPRGTSRQSESSPRVRDSRESRESSLPERGSSDNLQDDYMALADVPTFAGIPYIDDPDAEGNAEDSLQNEFDPDLPPPPKWTRCCPADLFFTRNRETHDLERTDRMKDLENRFEHHIVRRAARVREANPSADRPQRIPSSKLVHWHKDDNSAGPNNADDNSSDSSSTDEEEDRNLDELNSHLIDELQRKQSHPERVHPELWFNEPMEMNDGPLCHCSEKAKKAGIRHNRYPGEEVVTKCDPDSNNASKLFHYTITMSPPTNFLTKNPTVINYDSHEYIFEGFSLFSHYKIEKVPVCKVIRFNIEYTIHWLEDDMPENFSIRSLDMFSEFMFTELLELYDLDWQSTPDQCARFHFMPRFARKLPDNGKELLSMNEILNYLLKSTRPLVDKSDLSKCRTYTQRQWQSYVDQVRGMLVSYPGKRPNAIRIDQLDRHQDPGGDPHESKSQYPMIIHFGVRPAQLSYAGDPTYQRVWKEYMKLKHLVANKPKVTTKDKEDLKKKEDILQDIRIRGSMKREVTVELSSEGYQRTGIRSDVSQHALLLPVLITHLRFHKCLDVLEHLIQYRFRDKYLLQLALTHPSYRTNYGTNPDHSRNSLSNCGMRQLEYGDRRVHYVHTRKRGINTLIHIMAKLGRREETASEINHYERLEFLGDAVVEFLSSIHLFFMFPNLAEGGLAMYRAAIVQNQHLTVLARKLGLQNFMLYGHGPDLCQDYSLRHAMANCFEALMGALLIDSGIEVADRIFAFTLFGDQPDLNAVYTNLPPHPLQEDEPNGDRHWIISSPPLQKMARFEESIGFEFTHIRLLARAFTMRNVGFNHLTFGHNQRMEFLGDTVLQFISSEYLYKHFPDHHEGHLSLLRSSLVNNRTQAVVCDDLGMAEYIINSDHRFVEKNELKMKEKADLVEAFLGSLYIDKDLEYCKMFCKVCFFPRLKQFIMNQDWNDPKSQLQQCCLTLRDLHDEDPDIPTYKVLQSTGPTNTRKYTVAVYFRGKRMAVGEGHSIQQAEMDAASNALQDKQKLFPHLQYQKAFLARKFKRYKKGKGQSSAHSGSDGDGETSSKSGTAREGKDRAIVKRNPEDY